MALVISLSIMCFPIGIGSPSKVQYSSAIQRWCVMVTVYRYYLVVTSGDLPGTKIAKLKLGMRNTAAQVRQALSSQALCVFL